MPGNRTVAQTVARGGDGCTAPVSSAVVSRTSGARNVATAGILHHHGTALLPPRLSPSLHAAGRIRRPGMGGLAARVRSSRGHRTTGVCQRLARCWGRTGIGAGLAVERCQCGTGAGWTEMDVTWRIPLQTPLSLSARGSLFSVDQRWEAGVPRQADWMAGRLWIVGQAATVAAWPRHRAEVVSLGIRQSRTCACFSMFVFFYVCCCSFQSILFEYFYRGSGRFMMRGNGWSWEAPWDPSIG